MADNLNAAQKVIADVVARHQRNEWGQHDGWWECCCSHEGAPPWTADHVAAEVDIALGGLTRVTRDHDEWDMPVNHVRWVSDWSEDDQ